MGPARLGLLDNEAAQRAPAAKRTSVERSIDELRPALSTCVQQFEGFSQRPEQIRDSGGGSVLAAVSATRKFELATEAYLTSLGIKVRAFGADASPFATTRDR
jgi:hypothetical protein